MHHKKEVGSILRIGLKFYGRIRLLTKRARDIKPHKLSIMKNVF